MLRSCRKMNGEQKTKAKQKGKRREKGRKREKKEERGELPPKPGRDREPLPALLCVSSLDRDCCPCFEEKKERAGKGKEKETAVAARLHSVRQSGCGGGSSRCGRVVSRGAPPELRLERPTKGSWCESTCFQKEQQWWRQTEAVLAASSNVLQAKPASLEGAGWSFLRVSHAATSLQTPHGAVPSATARHKSQEQTNTALTRAEAGMHGTRTRARVCFEAQVCCSAQPPERLFCLVFGKGAHRQTSHTVLGQVWCRGCGRCRSEKQTHAARPCTKAGVQAVCTRAQAGFKT